MIKLKSFSVSAINRALQSMWCKICNITGRVETLEIGGGGATPNLQQVLTAGSALDQSNSITGSGSQAGEGFQISNIYEIIFKTGGFGYNAGSYKTGFIFTLDPFQSYWQSQSRNLDNTPLTSAIIRIETQPDPFIDLNITVGVVSDISYIKISQDSLQMRANGLSVAFPTAYAGGVTERILPISVNGNFANAAGNIFIGGGGATPNLQQVTDVGNNTTNAVNIENASLSVYSSDVSRIAALGLNAGSGYLSLKGGIGFSGFLLCDNITGSDKSFQLPNTIGGADKTLAISVDGNFADAAGNIVSGNNYSLNETLTGSKWINNKPIYRKVIEGAMVNISSYSVFDYEYIPSGIQDIIRKHCFLRTSGGNSNVEFLDGGFGGNLVDNQLSFRIDIAAGTLAVISSVNSAPSVVFVIIEYTKTAD